MANDFTADANCVALYNLEDGALTTDSKGAHTLTNYGVASNVAHQQGSYSGDFNPNDYMERTNASGFTNFPGDTANMDLSAGGWVYTSATPGNNAGYVIAAKQTNLGNRSWILALYNQAGTLRWMLSIGNGATNYDTFFLTPANAIASGRWYHVMGTHNHTTKASTIRAYDVTNGATDQAGETSDYALGANTGSFRLGATATSTWYADLYLDEIAVFNDVLTSDEIDAIRAGTYGAGGTTHDLAVSIAAAAALTAASFQSHSLGIGLTPAASLTVDLYTNRKLLATTINPTATVAGKLGMGWGVDTSIGAAGSVTAAARLIKNVKTEQVYENNFSDDPNCVACYFFDTDPGMTADSVGTNTLTAVGLPSLDPHTMQGSRSLDVDRAQNDSVYIPNGSMNAGFPLSTGKDATSDHAMSLVFWYRCTAYVALQTRWCVIWRNDADAAIYHGIQLTSISLGTPYFNRCINGNILDILDAACPINQWVFVAYRMRNIDATHLDCELDVWNDTSQSWVYSGNWLNYAGQVALTAGRFEIGTGSDGQYDQVVLFKDYLTDSEIVDIKDGVYVPPGGTPGGSSGTMYSLEDFPVGVSRISAGLGLQRPIAVSVGALSSISASLQVKSNTYVPGMVLMEPYPIPLLWNYKHLGLETGLDGWADALQRWCEEHMTKVMREVSRIGQEKEAEWLD